VRFVDDVRTGLRFIARRRLVRLLVVTVMVMNFIDWPVFAVLLPVYAREVLGSAVDLGLVIGAFGLGGLAGASAYAVLGPRLPRRFTFIAGLTALVSVYWFMTTLPGIGPMVAMFALLGLMTGPLNPILQTVGFEQIPPELIARVWGALAAGSLVAAPLGMLTAGFVVETAGIRTAVVAIASVYLLLIAVFVAHPAVSAMDRPVHPDHTTS